MILAVVEEIVTVLASRLCIRAVELMDTFDLRSVHDEIRTEHSQRLRG